MKNMKSKIKKNLMKKTKMKKLFYLKDKEKQN